MELLEFPHILPRVPVMNVAENTMSCRLVKVKTSDRGLLNRRNLTGKIGVHNVYPAESQSQWVLQLFCNNFFPRLDVLPTAQLTLFTPKQEIPLRLPVPNRQCGLRSMTDVIVYQLWKIYIRQYINIIAENQIAFLPKGFGELHPAGGVAQICPLIGNADSPGKRMPSDRFHNHVREMMHIDYDIRDTTCHHLIQCIVQQCFTLIFYQRFRSLGREGIEPRTQPRRKNKSCNFHPFVFLRCKSNKKMLITSLKR